MNRLKAILIAVALDALVVVGVAVGLTMHLVQPPVMIMLALVLFSGTAALLVLVLCPAKLSRPADDSLTGYAVSSSLEPGAKS